MPRHIVCPGFCTCRKRDGGWRGNKRVAGPVVGLQQRPGPANDTNAGPVVPATPAPGEASGTVAAASFTAMRKVVEFKEMGMGALANTCGLGMALKAMADSEKNPILIDGAMEWNYTYTYNYTFTLIHIIIPMVMPNPV